MFPSLRKIGFYIKNLNNKHIILGNLYNTWLRCVNVFANKRLVRCNLCGWEGYEFYAMIGYHSIRYNAVCPHCFAKERHRSLILYLEENNVTRMGLRCLDIGPVKSFRNYIEGKGCFYLSVDICSSFAMSAMDVTCLGIKNNKFDLIFCYHVLEHVENDIMALRELCRVLKPEGKCFIQVPLNRRVLETVEYGEPDAEDCEHVRCYGRDITARIADGGFKVKEVKVTFNDKNKLRKFALDETKEPLFICQKNSHMF